MTWEGLSPPYSTIVADPPWPHHRGYSTMSQRDGHPAIEARAYSHMSYAEIAALPVGELAGDQCGLWMWATSSALPHAFGIMRAWGFAYSQTMVWAKPPMGYVPGGLVSQTGEFILLGRRGRAWWRKSQMDRSVFGWPRVQPHSVKPPGFLDLVERVSPGPYLELFARQPRLGWDSWGWGYEEKPLEGAK